MITRVYSAGIFVRDQQKALEFFTETLGFDLISEQPMGPDARWIEIAPTGSGPTATKLILYTPPGTEGQIGTFSNVLFRCDDIQKTYEELTAKGVHFPDAPVKQFWGWWAMFEDQDGNKYGLGQDD